MARTVEDRDEKLTYPQLQSVALLRTCMGDDRTGFLEIRRLPSKRQHFFDLSDPDALYDAADVGAAIEGENVFFGISPRVRQRGKNEDVQRCHVLFADLDTDEALDELDRQTRDGGLPEPSFLVCSGGLTERGRQKLHVYWALSAPVDPETAREAKQRLIAVLGSDPQVHDPSRVARLPLTRYHKDGSGREARVLKGSANRRYALEDVVGKLPAALALPPPSMNGHGAETAIDGRPAIFELFGHALKRAGESRNRAAFDLACATRDHGYTQDEARELGSDVVVALNALKPTNASGAHELYTAKEWEATVRSAFSKPPRTPRLGPAVNGSSARRVTAQRASSIRAEAVRWAWEDRIPLGALTVIAGQQGLGKSTLTLGLAAKVTTGELAGDLKGKPTSVLIVTLEDHLASVCKPRLMAAKANTDLVSFVTVTTDTGEDLITLPDDIAGIERLVNESGAKLVVVDPVVATLAGGIDSHRDRDVRRALAPTAKLAERCDLAVLGVMHLNKGATTDLISRVSGSIAFTAGPRSVLAFARDPEDPEGDEGDLRVIVHAKSNWGRFAPALACRVEQRRGEVDSETYSASKIVFTGTSSVTAGDLSAIRSNDDRSALGEAIEFLEAELADGPKSVRSIKSACLDAGIAWRTLERAKKPLGVQVAKTAGAWEWSLKEDRQPLGGLGVGGLGGLPESPVTTGDLPTPEMQGRQTNKLAVLPSKPDLSAFVREPRDAI